MSQVISYNILFLGLFVALLWAIPPIAHKFLLKTIDVNLIMIIGGFSYFACLLVYTMYHYNDVKINFPKLSWTEIFLISVTSIIMAFLANLIYLYMLKKHESYIVCAITYSSPIFVLMFALLFFKQKINFYGYIGVILTVVGLIILSFNDKHKIR